MNLVCFIPLLLRNMGGWQLIVVALLVLLLFGGKKIPELMRGLGRGVHEFKQGLEDAKREINKPINTGDDETTKKPKANDETAEKQKANNVD